METTCLQFTSMFITCQQCYSQLLYYLQIHHDLLLNCGKLIKSLLIFQFPLFRLSLTYYLDPDVDIIIKNMKCIDNHKQKTVDPQSIFLFLKHFENERVKSLTPSILDQIENLTNQEKDWSLLHMCANSNNIEMAKYYLEEHRKLMLGSRSSYNLSTKQAWINRKDKEGFTCLHLAVFRGAFPLVQLLEQNGADIYQVNGEGLTILHIAAQADSPVLIYYFLSKGLKINVKDFKGNTPLHWACYCGMENSTAALISWEAELDKRQDNYGMTPLHLAVMSGNSHIVKKLLVKGCDRNVLSYTGKRAIDIARENSYLNLIDMINDNRGICQIFSFKPPYRKPMKFGVHFFLFLFFFLSTYLLNVATFVAYFDTNQLVAIGLCIAYTIWGGATFIVFLSLVFSNPGKLSNRIHRHRQFFEKLLNKKPSTLCFDCGIIKPERSKHCQVCQSCISVFDHHCPWLSNCVGSYNFALFYFFILMLVIFILLTFAVSIAEIIFYRVSVLSLLNAVYGLLLGMIFIVPIIILLIIQSKNAANDRTTFQNHIIKNPLSTSRRQKSESNASQISKSLNSDNVETNSMYRRSSVSKQTSHTDNESNKWVQNCFSMCCNNRHNTRFKTAY